MKSNTNGIVDTGCKVGNHDDVITKECGNNSCPYPTHRYCRSCNQFVGNKLGIKYPLLADPDKEGDVIID